MSNKTFQIVKLHFQSPLHLSRGQTNAYDVSESVLHSDTIKSAIFAAAKMLKGENADEAFFDSFQVSSAFPYYGDLCFFPKPLKTGKDTLHFKDMEPAKAIKKAKKLQYLAQPYFEQLISGNTPIEVAKHQFKQGDTLLFPEEYGDVSIFSAEEQQRLVTASEPGEDGTPYYLERLYFSENSGFFFLIEKQANANRDLINGAIKLLGDEGIGTDKHVGNGIFEPTFTELSLNVPENPDAQMLLSLYLPKEEELDEDKLKQSAYQMNKRGGYIASPEDTRFLTFRKHSIYMFREASVFPANMPVSGKKANLCPEHVQGLEHPIWRDGRAFTVPLTKKQSDG